MEVPEPPDLDVPEQPPPPPAEPAPLDLGVDGGIDAAFFFDLAAAVAALPEPATSDVDERAVEHPAVERSAMADLAPGPGPDDAYVGVLDPGSDLPFSPSDSLPEAPDTDDDHTRHVQRNIVLTVVTILMVLLAGTASLLSTKSADENETVATPSTAPSTSTSAVVATPTRAPSTSTSTVVATTTSTPLAAVSAACRDAFGQARFTHYDAMFDQCTTGELLALMTDWISANPADQGTILDPGELTKHCTLRSDPDHGVVPTACIGIFGPPDPASTTTSAAPTTTAPKTSEMLAQTGAGSATTATFTALIPEWGLRWTYNCTASATGSFQVSVYQGFTLLQTPVNETSSVQKTGDTPIHNLAGTYVLRIEAPPDCNWSLTAYVLTP